MAITRTTLTDDSGDGLSGTIWNNARLQAVYDAVENDWLSDTYTPTWGNLGTANTTTDATISGAYLKLGKLCFFQVSLGWGAGTASGSGGWTFTLPFTANSRGVYGNAEALYVDSSLGQYWRGTVLTNSTTTVSMWTNASPMATVGTTAPFTWASGDSLYLTGWFIIA